MYHTVVDGVSYDAWAMTYTGTLGLMLAIVQTLVVGAAAVASALPRAGMLRWRRIGHGILVGWAALWLANLFWLFSIDHALGSFAQAALVGVLFGCTVARAATGWTPGPSTLTPDDPEGGRRTFGGAPPGSLDATAFAAALGTARSWVTSRVTRCVPAARRGAAHGLIRVADFARSQASRLDPTMRNMDGTVRKPGYTAGIAPGTTEGKGCCGRSGHSPA
jgi:hypothetical protein